MKLKDIDELNKEFQKETAEIQDTKEIEKIKTKITQICP